MITALANKLNYLNNYERNDRWPEHSIHSRLMSSINKAEMVVVVAVVAVAMEVAMDVKVGSTLTKNQSFEWEC